MTGDREPKDATTPDVPAAPMPEGAPLGARPVAGFAATRRVLRIGTIVSAAVFAVALLLRFMGHPAGSGDALDPGAVLAACIALDPWGWATLGVLVVIVTPVLAIAATGHEHRVAGDRRTALLSIAVLGVLGLSLAVALLR